MGTNNIPNINISELVNIIRKIWNNIFYDTSTLCCINRENLQITILVGNQNYRPINSHLCIALKHRVTASWPILCQLLGSILKLFLLVFHHTN